MGFWYLLPIVIGSALFVKFSFFHSQKRALSVQLSLLGLGLIAFGVFMFTPTSVKLIDFLFS